GVETGRAVEANLVGPGHRFGDSCGDRGGGSQPPVRGDVGADPHLDTAHGGAVAGAEMFEGRVDRRHHGPEPMRGAAGRPGVQIGVDECTLRRDGADGGVETGYGHRERGGAVDDGVLAHEDRLRVGSADPDVRGVGVARWRVIECRVHSVPFDWLAAADHPAYLSVSVFPVFTGVSSPTLYE